MKSIIRKQGIFKLFTVFASCVIVLIFFEITIRIFFETRQYGKSNASKISRTWLPEKYRDLSPYYNPAQTPFSYDVRPKMEYSNVLKFVPKPNYNGKGYHTNNNHFRYSEDFEKEKSLSEIRIFVTGGSSAWGWGVSQEQHFSNIMEKSFSAKHKNKKIRVINAGVTGYHSTQERQFIEKNILNLKPDIIIMFTGWNDVYAGYFGINILREVIPNHFLRPDYDDYFIKTFYYGAKALYKLKHPKKQLIYASKSLEPQEVLSVFLRNVNAIEAQSRQYGFDFVLCLQPSIFTTDKKPTGWENKTMEAVSNDELYKGISEYSRKVFPLFRSILPDYANKNNFLFIDSDEAIKYEEKSVFIDDAHLGDRGNVLIAELLKHSIDKIVEKRISAQGALEEK